MARTMAFPNRLKDDDGKVITTTYHTKPDGKGDAVKSVVAIGDGKYLDRAALTDAEFAEVKLHNGKRIATPRLNKALIAIDGLVNVAKNPTAVLTEEQCNAVMSHLTAKLQELEHALFKVKSDKGKVMIQL